MRQVGMLLTFRCALLANQRALGAFAVRTMLHDRDANRAFVGAFLTRPNTGLHVRHSHASLSTGTTFGSAVGTGVDTFLQH